MNFKKIGLLALGLSCTVTQVWAQNSDRFIQTAMSYQLTRPDARSSAMGGVGAATSSDAYSLYSNPSKTPFGKYKIEAGLSYVPLLPYLAKDVSLVNFSGFKKAGEKSAIGLSIYYLTYGKIEGKDENNNFTQFIFPVEYAIDFTYARKMADNFSLGLTGRFLHSDIHDGASNNTVISEPSNAFAADVSAYFEKEPLNGPYGAKWAFGAMISNIGTKVHYTESQTQFLPTNLKLGASYSFLLDKNVQKLTVSMDLNKLLVPTPPEYDNNGEIIDGKDPNRSVVSALFTSFADAPGGFSEELSEISIGTGAELLFDEMFAIRSGYFYESPKKGDRQHLALGAGMKYKNFCFDLGYVIPVTNRYIIKNSIKFSLGYGF